MSGLEWRLIIEALRIFMALHMQFHLRAQCDAAQKRQLMVVHLSCL